MSYVASAMLPAASMVLFDLWCGCSDLRAQTQEKIKNRSAKGENSCGCAQQAAWRAARESLLMAWDNGKLCDLW
jgi:hypothetical protein